MWQHRVETDVVCLQHPGKNPSFFVKSAEKSDHPERGLCRDPKIVRMEAGIDPRSPSSGKYNVAEGQTPSLSGLTSQILAAQEQLALGGGEKAIARQHSKGRLTARERIAKLIDPETPTLELGAWAGWEMYDEYGGAPEPALSL